MGSSSALVIPFVFYFAGTRLWRLVMDFLAVVLVLSLVASRSIFSLGVWSLSGYAALFPLVVGVLYWRRSTGAGAMAAILTIAVLWVVFLTRSLGVTGEYTVAGSGLMPVAVMFVGACLSFVLVSLVTRPPDDAVVDKFFPSW